jgi:acetyltransferase-like isoleucine patch superfamily enzyme
MNNLRKILRIGIKTLYINFKYLPLKQAILLPIWVSQRCYLLKLSGEIIIKNKITPGMIQIGYGNIGIFDMKRSRSILQILGKIIFNGKASIGHGCKLSIVNNGILEIGKNLTISAETSIICHKGIKIGNDCLFSWDVLLIDTDLHNITDETHEVINKPKQINIGDKVWIGCRSLILKGVDIPSGNIIAANSTIHSTQLVENAIIGGNPTRTLKNNINWEN